MIPKVIHYVWLSDDPLPASVKSCIKSWQKHAKNYEIRKWTSKDFELDNLPVYVKEAINVKKWAFACDYLRLMILEKEGGIYLDSDVVMLSSPDEFLNNEFFSSIEYYEDFFEEDRHLVNENGEAQTEMINGMAIQAAVMGSVPNHPFVRACRKYYEDRHFILEDGSLFTKMLAPHIYALVARDFGFKYFNREQQLDEGMHLYPSVYFAPYPSLASDESRMIHVCNGSWRDFGGIKALKTKISKKIKIIGVIRRKNSQK